MEKKTVETGKEVALDNEALRQLNGKKVVNAIDNMGNHFKELKKQNRVTFIIALITGVCFLLMLGAIVITAFSLGDSVIDNLVNRDLMAQRYNCSNSKNQGVIFRSSKGALDFIELYPESNCTFRDIRK